jgi:transaldolase
MIDTEAIAELTYDLARRDFSHPSGRRDVGFREKPIWQKVRALGTRLWLDTGDIDEADALWCCEFEALTTNNTLLNKEIQKGLYDDLVREAAEAIRRTVPQIDERELVLEIAFVLNARHALRLVERFDAHVSVELHTDLGHDVERSVAYGRRYFDICPERFYVKVPLTPAGLLAARKLGQEGVPVNFTLGFSARQNYAIAMLAQPRFVNVFMGRLNAFVADNGLGDGRNIGEKATLATQRMLVELRDARRTRSLLIGASVREGAQVAALAGLDVLTMPPKAAAQYETSPPARPGSDRSERSADGRRQFRGFQRPNALGRPPSLQGLRRRPPSGRYGYCDARGRSVPFCPAWACRLPARLVGRRRAHGGRRWQDSRLHHVEGKALQGCCWP